MLRAEVMNRLKTGYRMIKPDGCPDFWYADMHKSWDANPRERPTFKVLEGRLARQSLVLLLE